MAEKTSEVEEPRVISVERIERGGSNQGPEPDEKPAQGFLRWIWWIIVIFSGIWIIMPEPSDAVPIIGWLDEVLAFFVFNTGLRKLGIRIPFLSRFMEWRMGKKGKGPKV